MSSDDFQIENDDESVVTTELLLSRKVHVPPTRHESVFPEDEEYETNRSIFQTRLLGQGSVWCYPILCAYVCACSRRS